MPKTLAERLADIRAEAQTINAVTQGDDPRPLTDEEQTRFDELVAEAEKFKKTIANQAVASAALADMEAEDPDPVTDPGRTAATGRRQTPGDVVVNSDAYKAMKAAHPAGPPDRSKPSMGSVNIGSFKAAVTVGTPTEQPLHVIAPMSLTAIDIFNAINIVEDAPDTIRIFRSVFTNNADVVATGVTKPESNLVITPDTVNLEVIAHHTPIDKKTLWHNALLRNKIDVAMVNGVRGKAQAEVAAELEVARLAGLLQEQGFDTDFATTLRKAMTKAMRGIAAIGGTPMISVAISLEDHEALDLELLDAMVALAGQELAPTGRIWRANVVPLFGLPEGVAYVGDLKQVDFYVGQGISVTTGWVNEQFIENRLTILAEMEAKAAIIGGAAIVATDLDATAEPNFS